MTEDLARRLPLDSSVLGRRPKLFVKRVIDVVVAATVLFLLLPLLIFVAGAIWLSDGGSPIFRHRRLGRNGQAFGCLKFRSMVVDSERRLAAHLVSSSAARAEWEETHKLTHDPRVTMLGRVLRKTSVDELPQLINVVRGEMSLVGPRPIVQAEVERYGSSFAMCFSMPPGVTGQWQVSGRSNTSYLQRVALDLDYAAHWSLRRDIVILVRTIPAVFAQRGSF